MADSILAGLKARREALVAEQTVLLPVPGWTNPTLHLRIKPVAHEIIDRMLGRLEKAPEKQKGKVAFEGNAAVVSAATVGVLIDGTEPELTLSNPDLLEGLGLDDVKSNAEVIRALVLRDGDVVALSTAVMKHSGYANEIIEEDLSGE